MRSRTSPSCRPPSSGVVAGGPGGSAISKLFQQLEQAEVLNLGSRPERFGELTAPLRLA